MEAISCVFCSIQKKVKSQGVSDQCFFYIPAALIFEATDSILDASKLYNNRDETVGPLVVYFNASIEYFSRQHLPFALLVMCVLLVFVVSQCYCSSCTP